MAVGDRIKRVRNFRKMTMKELGMAVGFDENTADVRIAQYENNSRKPKDELLKKIAAALDVNWRSLYDPVDYAAEDIMFSLFELEEQRIGLRLLDVVDDTDPDFPEKRVGITFNYPLLDRFLTEWLQRRRELQAGEDGVMKASAGWTNIFIYPGYRFKVLDALITNFHLPESTLIMLVSALAGREQVLAAYKEAVEEKYRFFSFGDAMFIS